MIYDYTPSFDRSFKRLPPTHQERVRHEVKALVDFFATGQRTAGLGLKQLRKPWWEIRVGLDVRVLFAFEGDVISFVLVGNHDDIRRYLKHV